MGGGIGDGPGFGSVEEGGRGERSENMVFLMWREVACEIGGDGTERCVGLGGMVVRLV